LQLHTSPAPTALPSDVVSPISIQWSYRHCVLFKKIAFVLVKFMSACTFVCLFHVYPLIKGVGRKFPGGGGNGKTRPKNSTIKPLSPLALPCTKIQRGGMAPLLPATDVHISCHEKVTVVLYFG